MEERRRFCAVDEREGACGISERRGGAGHGFSAGVFCASSYSRGGILEAVFRVGGESDGGGSAVRYSARAGDARSGKEVGEV
jgi:hypothetical protein